MPPRLRSYAVLPCTALALLAACDRPTVAWVDATPRRTTMPSPLAAEPRESAAGADSTLVAGSPLARFLLEQDLLREAGAQTLLTAPDGLPADASLDALDEARDPLTITKATPLVASPAGPAGGVAEGAAPMADMAHAGHTMTQAAAPAVALGNGSTPEDAGQCARTLRMARMPGRGTVAVWWTRAARGRVHLVAAWRDAVAGDSTPAPWRGPLAIDTLDMGAGDAQAAEAGVYGCLRPAPGLAVDTRTAFVHVAYTLRGPEGVGVFYAHQMDPRAAFEPPQAILYGERLGVARVAADGDVVGVAYEDPNVRGLRRIGLAVSRTAGHTFEEVRLDTGADGADARDPYLRVTGRALLLGWSEVTERDVPPAFVVRRAVVQRPPTAR